MIFFKNHNFFSMKKLGVLRFLAAALFVLFIQNQAHPQLGRSGAVADDPDWTPIGPPGGNIKSFSFNLANPSEIFAILSPSQVYRTADAGQTWGPSAVFNSNLFDIAFDPWDPNIIYILGEISVFKSIDRGLNWAEYPLGNSCHGSANISICSANPNVIYVGGRYSTGDWAVFKSTDGGRHWSTIVLGGAYSADCLCVAVAPSNPDIVYASGWHYINLGGASYYYLKNTLDGGITWKTVGFSSTSSIVVDATNSLNVYAAFAGIQRSTDGGLTWTKNNGDAAARRLAIDPYNPNILYGGADASVYKSTDGGVNWTKRSQGLNGNCNSLRASSNRVYFASTAGIFKSEDGGMSWQASDSQIYATQISVFAISPSSPNVIYAVADGSGIFRSTDTGVTWEKTMPLAYHSNFIKMLVNPKNAQDLFLLERQLWRSSDGGSTIKGDIDVFNKMDVVKDFDIYEGNPDHLFACGSGIDYKNYTLFMALEKSTDGGKSWTVYRVSQAISQGYTMALDPENDGILYVGGETGENKKGALFRSENGGLDWMQIDGGVFGSPILDIALDRLSSNTIYAGTSAGFYRTENLGKIWKKTLSFPVKCIETNSLDTDEICVAGDSGIYRSVDKGRTWTDLSSGSIETQINGLALSAQDRYLYAGTSGSSILRLMLPALPVPQMIYAPLNFSGVKKVNRSLSQAEYINVLSWKPNPENKGIVAYRIFRVDGGLWGNMLAQVNANTFEFRQRKVAASRVYIYVLLAVSQDGREGESTSTIVR